MELTNSANSTNATYARTFMLPNKQGTEEKGRYIIKQINTTISAEGKQTITAMRYYPYYDE